MVACAHSQSSVGQGVFSGFPGVHVGHLNSINIPLCLCGIEAALPPADQGQVTPIQRLTSFMPIVPENKRQTSRWKLQLVIQWDPYCVP